MQEGLDAEAFDGVLEMVRVYLEKKKGKKKTAAPPPGIVAVIEVLHGILLDLGEHHTLQNKIAQVPPER